MKPDLIIRFETKANLKLIERFLQNTPFKPHTKKGCKIRLKFIFVDKVILVNY